MFLCQIFLFFYSFVVVQSPSHVWLFATPWTAACQASLFFTISWNLLKLMSNHLILCCTISSYPQSFPASGSFPVSQLFASCGQIIESLTSVLPVNIQGWFPLGLTGLISLQSKDSQVFSSPTASILWHSLHLPVVIVLPLPFFEGRFGIAESF